MIAADYSGRLPCINPCLFLKFILLAFLLVSLPLVYALAELILSLDRLQTQGQQAVQEAAQAGRASRQLLEQSGTLERVVRQHLILEDAALLDDYARVRQEFQATLRQLSELPLSRPQLTALEGLGGSESRLHDLLRAQPRSADAACVSPTATRGSPTVRRRCWAPPTS